MPPKLYTPREAAALLRVAHITVKRRIADGSLRTVDVGVPGKPAWRISEDALNEFIEARTNVA